MAAIVIRTRYDEGTESAEVATSVDDLGRFDLKMFCNCPMTTGNYFLNVVSSTHEQNSNS
jgi:hypothetical protein